MKTESIFTSQLSERRWLDDLINTFKSNVIIPPTIFQVPKSISETKPQAYIPQSIGLGPYHHVRPEFYTSQRNKLSLAKHYLTKDQIHHFNLAIDNLSLIDIEIRGYYDKFLDFDDELKTLQWILIIDSLYLLYLLHSRVSTDHSEISTKLAQDVIMLENQIPSIALIQTQIIAKISGSLHDTLYTNFCKAHSPLKLTKVTELNSHPSPHLLAHMYHLIVNNTSETNLQEAEKRAKSQWGGVCKLKVDDYQLGEMAELVLNFLPGGETIAKPVIFLANLPWDHIKGLVKKEDDEKENNNNNKPLVEEIEIPSVTELNEIAKINFKLTPNEGGIRDIKFVEENNEGRERVFYLPEITLNTESEVVLRNLVAYEAAIAGLEDRGWTSSRTLELAEYVDLMCGIVDTPKDVEILKKSEIIKGSLSNEEIADLFNGISKTTGKYKEKKSELEMAIETVNQKFDNIFKVKVRKFVKKHIYKSRKCFSVVATVLVILLLSLQSFCQAYGCSR